MYSVIIPVYNKETYITRTIKSVLEQTFTEFELIIIDDGSTDKSMDYVREFNDNRIKIFSQKNSGVSAARNKGIAKAQNEYIAFIDADDIWQNQFLEKITSLINKVPEAGAYYTNYEIIKNEKRTAFKKQNKIQEILLEDYFEYALRKQAMWTASVVIRKSVFKDIGLFPTNYRIGEDLYLWTKLALNYKIAHSSYVGAFYFTNVQNSLTDLKVSKRLLNESFANDAEIFLYQNIDKAVNKENFKEYMIGIITSKSKYLLKQNKKKQVRKILKKYNGTKYYKKKVFFLYIISFFPSICIRKIF